MEEYMQLLVEKQKASEERQAAVGQALAARPQYLVFSVGGLEYAVPILKVKTVMALPVVTPLPYAPKACRGVINLRGRIVSLMDLRVRMNVQPHDSRHVSVVVLESGAHCIGMIVDGINRVLEAESDAAIEGVAKLDVDWLLGDQAAA
jgi:purine-binding chemotaxis protein CheW